MIDNYVIQAEELFSRQKIEWEQCKLGYESLSTVKIKRFLYDGFSINVQYNPGRLISTSAKVDPKSINERKCFLCLQNLPKKQRRVDYKNQFMILVNPFPIFPGHFTIPSYDHEPQQIVNSFHVMLELSKDLMEHYTVFYNGPKCGASAPDHLHFQAGTKNFMSIEPEYNKIKNLYGKIINSSPLIKTFSMDDGLRKFISAESSNYEELVGFFQKFYSIITSSIADEPMLNILANYTIDGWKVIFFIREKHRPRHYFATGDEQILLSPASVDVGGVCITPREVDFNKITQKNIEDIFTEVFISREKLERICEALKK